MTALHAPPGQRLRAKLIEGKGHPIVRFELAGVPPDIEGLRRAARQARREPWADMPGQADVLCALAGARLGDQFLITRVRFGAWHWRIAVHRRRRGVLRCVGIVDEQSLARAEKATDLLKRYASEMLIPRLVSLTRLQRPTVRKRDELRLAPGSRVRLTAPAPANDARAA